MLAAHTAPVAARSFSTPFTVQHDSSTLQGLQAEGNRFAKPDNFHSKPVGMNIPIDLLRVSHMNIPVDPLSVRTARPDEGIYS